MGRILLILCLTMAGCAGSPTAPTMVSDVLDVDGTYSGTLTQTVTGAKGHPPMRGDSMFVVTVSQSSHEVTLSATRTWPGRSPVLVWDGLTGTIDSLGVFTERNTPGSFDDADCGRVRYRSRHLQFSFGTLYYRLLADTDRCGRFEFDAALTRLRMGG